MEADANSYHDRYDSNHNLISFWCNFYSSSRNVLASTARLAYKRIRSTGARYQIIWAIVHALLFLLANHMQYRSHKRCIHPVGPSETTCEHISIKQDGHFKVHTPPNDWKVNNRNDPFPPTRWTRLETSTAAAMRVRPSRILYLVTWK